MKIIYTTLNNNDEARMIGRKLLEMKLCNCVNFFPIQCIYNFEDKIQEEPEVVLLIKTIKGKFKDVEAVIKNEIDYINFIGELNVENLSDGFSNWLNSIVK